MYCRGIRGATTVESNDPDVIVEATRELLEAIICANDIHREDIASAIFSTTPDLTTAFPAKAARDIGWGHVALFCCQEIAVQNSFSRCIRVLIHWNTSESQEEIVHVYLKGAKKLRPDISGQ